MIKTMGSIGIYRVRRDLRSLGLFKTAFWEAKPRDDDMFVWDCVAKPINGSEIRLTLELGLDWPLMPPKIKLVSKVFHPCVSSDGRLELFDNDWSSAFSVGVIMLCVVALFNDGVDTKDRVTERTAMIRDELVEAIYRREPMLDI